MQSQYLFLALDLARERADEANRERLAALGHPARPGRIRRFVARTAIAVARAADERVVARTQVATH